MKAIKLLARVFLAQTANSLAAFADCDAVLKPITQDAAALEQIKALHDSKEWRFSS